MKRYNSITKKPILIAVAVCLIFVSVLVYEIFIKDMLVSALPDGVFYAQYIDVGQGDSTLLTTPNGKYVLIDTSTSSAENDLIGYLEKVGVKDIEYLILSHPHEDHIGNASSIIKRYNVKKVIMPDATSLTTVFENLLKTIENKQCECLIASPGDTYELDGITINILGPYDIDEENANNSSIVCKITYGYTSFLFTGDMEKERERDLLERNIDLSCDVLKAGHHGSNTSSSKAFLDAVRPDIAVISCGEDNEYGHPHQEILNRLNSMGIKYYRTDMHGTVIIKSDGKTVEYYEE